MHPWKPRRGQELSSRPTQCRLQDPARRGKDPQAKYRPSLPPRDRLGERRVGARLSYPAAPSDRVAEPATAGPDPLATAPLKAGQLKERGADAFNRACRKQKAESRKTGEKVGILGVASLANEPRKGVPSQDTQGPSHPLSRVSDQGETIPMEEDPATRAPGSPSAEGSHMGGSTRNGRQRGGGAGGCRPEGGETTIPRPRPSARRRRGA